MSLLQATVFSLISILRLLEIIEYVYFLTELGLKYK